MAARKKLKGSAVKMMLRTCRADMTSHGGFRWPRPDEDLGHGLGVAVAPDWDPSPVPGSHLRADLAVTLCDGHHDWVHANIAEARELGLLVDSWDVQP